MLLNMLVYNIAYLHYGVFDYKIHLPLHLCFISGYLFIFGIFTKNEKILKITFFLSFIGPLPAIIFPEMPSAWESFEFYEYFISHHFFMILSFFSYYALNLKITIKDVVITYILVNVLFLSLMPFNKLLNTNYMFSSGIPEFILELIPLLRYIHPIIILEILGTAILLILYQIPRIRNKELKAK